MNCIVVLDRSGSMECCVDDTIGGFNQFVAEQVKSGGTLTLYLFDHELIKVHDKVPIESVEKMTRNTYIPRGSTALFDAIGCAIKSIAPSEANTTTVVILTDGEENSSRQYRTKAHIKDLVEMSTANGVTFLYLAANQDAFKEGNGFGIQSDNIMEFDTQTQCRDAFRSAANCINSRSNGQHTPLTPQRVIVIPDADSQALEY